MHRPPDSSWSADKKITFSDFCSSSLHHPPPVDVPAAHPPPHLGLLLGLTRPVLSCTGRMGGGGGLRAERACRVRLEGAMHALVHSYLLSIPPHPLSSQKYAFFLSDLSFSFFFTKKNLGPSGNRFLILGSKAKARLLSTFFCPFVLSRTPPYLPLSLSLSLSLSHLDKRPPHP